MLDVDRVWARVAQRSDMQGKQLKDFILQAFVYTTQLTSTQGVSNQPVTFPAGAIVLAVVAGAQINGQAATVQGRIGLDMFTVQMQSSSDNRNLVGASQAIASSVYGPYGDQFPAKEIVIPTGGGFLYALTNLTTSTINVYLTHHVLQPATVT